MGLRPTNGDESPTTGHSERSEESASYLFLAKADSSSLLASRNDRAGWMTFDGAKRGICFLFVFSKEQQMPRCARHDRALRRAILTTPLLVSVRIDGDIKR